MVQPEDRPALKKAGFLTRDPRAIERKKYGLKKARKRRLSTASADLSPLRPNEPAGCCHVHTRRGLSYVGGLVEGMPPDEFLRG